MKTPSFWLWFIANEKALRGINHLNKRKRSKLIYWFSKHLGYYNPKIGFRLIVPLENQGTPSIAFSAGENIELRPDILHLMKTAPHTKKWIITASLTSLADNDPDYFEKGNYINGIYLKPSNIKFWGLSIHPDTRQFFLGIVLDLPIAKKDENLLYEAVESILIDTLGEERYYHYIEDFCIYSELPEDEDLLSLKDLKQYLEGY